MGPLRPMKESTKFYENESVLEEISVFNDQRHITRTLTSFIDQKEIYTFSYRGKY